MHTYHHQAYLPARAHNNSAQTPSTALCKCQVLQGRLQSLAMVTMQQTLQGTKHRAMYDVQLPRTVLAHCSLRPPIIEHISLKHSWAVTRLGPVELAVAEKGAAGAAAITTACFCLTLVLIEGAVVACHETVGRSKGQEGMHELWVQHRVERTNFCHDIE